MCSIIFIGIICLPITALGTKTDCPKKCFDVEGRMEQEHCASNVLRIAEEELQKYLMMSRRAWKEAPDFVERIDTAQRHWLEFRKTACSTVSATWTTGTDRSLATLACENDLTRRWTHILWEYFSPELKRGGLPEPRPGGE